jgi:hypothetical protein
MAAGLLFQRGFPGTVGRSLQGIWRQSELGFDSRFAHD